MPNEADLRAFLEETGRSLTGAQQSLAGAEAAAPLNIVVSQVELEVKAALQKGEDGSLGLQLISASDVRAGSLAPELISTIRANFMASPEPAPSATAKLAKDDVVAAFRRREDVAALDKAVRGLTIDATFLPERKRWLVTARDPEGRLAREALVPDE